MRDFKNPAQCLLQIETGTKLLTIDSISSTTSSNFTFTLPEFNDCSGTKYNIQSIENGNGLADTTTMNQYPAGKISFLLT